MYNFICTNPECLAEFITERKTRKYCSLDCANRHKAIKKRNEASIADRVSVWGCGGGIQSTAVAALIEAQVIPKPDYCVFTDCGYDAEQTIDYVENVIFNRLKKLNIACVRLDVNQYSDTGIYDQAGYIRLPLYVKQKDMSVAKLPTHCNSAWKWQPIMRWMRDLGMQYVENWIGISSDEYKRHRPSKKLWISYRYPLLEQDINRDSCAWLAGYYGWPKPSRSSCIMCPNHGDNAWRDVAANDRERRRVIRIEHEIRLRNENFYLHNSCMPIEKVMNDIEEGYTRCNY